MACSSTMQSNSQLQQLEANRWKKRTKRTNNSFCHWRQPLCPRVVSTLMARSNLGSVFIIIIWPPDSPSPVLEHALSQGWKRWRAKQVILQTSNELPSAIFINGSVFSTHAPTDPPFPSTHILLCTHTPQFSLGTLLNVIKSFGFFLCTGKDNAWLWLLNFSYPSWSGALFSGQCWRHRISKQPQYLCRKI